MDYMQLFGSKLIILVVFILGACTTTEQMQEQAQKQDNTPSSEVTNTQKVETPVSNAPKQDPVVVTYQNKSSNIQLTLNPDEDEFFIDLQGMAPNKTDSVVIVDSVLIQNRAKDIQTLLSSYRKAQDLFYLGEYRNALEEVDKTLAIQETADAYALKGTIFFMLENPTAARANWNKAVQLDPNIPVPSIPELETLINDIREDGEP